MMGNVARVPSEGVRRFKRDAGKLEARFGADETLRLFSRAFEALDLLGIDRRKGMWFALRGAQILADAPELSTRELADKLSELWAARAPEPAA
jgi:hypothetical protein